MFCFRFFFRVTQAVILAKTTRYTLDLQKLKHLGNYSEKVQHLILRSERVTAQIRASGTIYFWVKGLPLPWPIEKYITQVEEQLLRRCCTKEAKTFSRKAAVCNIHAVATFSTRKFEEEEFRHIASTLKQIKYCHLHPAASDDRDGSQAILWVNHSATRDAKISVFRSGKLTIIFKHFDMLDLILSIIDEIRLKFA